MLVPKPHNFLIGDWDLTTLGTDKPTFSTSHPNPWAYLARVPIIVYGDGIPAGREIEEITDITQLAPSYARLLGFDMGAGVSAPLPGLDQPDRTSPKAIVTVVIDGGGWNALQAHPDSWPNIARLMEEGTTYVNATIGSAPSITGALHATFGTGVYPTTHGVPGNRMRGPDGSNIDAWLDNADPRYLACFASTKSEIVVPIFDGGGVIGEIDIDGSDLDAFDATDARFLEEIAALLAPLRPRA